MRDAIVRGSMTAVAMAIVVLVLPDALLRIWILTRGEPTLSSVIHQLHGPRGVVLVISSSVIQIGLALLVSRAIADRRARAIAGRMAELSDSAERLGAGSSRVERLDSGIPEVDQVSAVLARNSARITRQLAQQRDFAADASHQLRTPLTALLMRLDEIAATDDLEVAREEALIAIGQIERLTGVVDDLLARSRHSDEPGGTVSLDSVLATLQREYQPAFARARRSVRVLGERGLRVEAAGSAVAQIVSTMFENSLQHGRGTVSVEVRRSGPSVILQVSDQGDGVPVELAPRIFERAVSSSGSGLGLALARDLAAANGGRLELISAQPAVFALFLSEAAREQPATGLGATPEQSSVLG